jgi:hypothetical protein
MKHLNERPEHETAKHYRRLMKSQCYCSWMSSFMEANLSLGAVVPERLSAVSGAHIWR